MKTDQLHRMIASYPLPSEKTAARYRQLALALLGGDKTIGSIGGYAEARAALVYHAVTTARDILAVASANRSETMRRQLTDAARFLEMFPPGGGTGLTYLGPRSTKTQRKRRIYGLPPDWRNRIFAVVMQQCPEAAPAVAVLEVTGLRPAELAKGVTITRLPQGQLSLAITGAKVNDTRGQPWREIVAFATHPRVQWLQQLLDFLGKETATITLTRQRLHAVVTAASRNAFPGRADHMLPTPRTYRDQLSADLKNACPPIDVASVLGHLSERSQNAYAGSHHARGPVQWLSQTDTSRAIKPFGGPPWLGRPLVSSANDPTLS